MDEKGAQSNMPCSRTSPRRRPLLAVILLVGIVYNFWYWSASLFPTPRPLSSSAAGSPKDAHPTAVVAIKHDSDAGRVLTKGLVPLEAHIISKCPDTRDALRTLILPVMQRVYDKVDFKLSYIGTPTANDGVHCMHGPSECMGNIIELCARELYPDPKINLGFIMCLTKDYKNIPERSLIEDCALEHAVDFKRLNDCATRDDGAHGLDMLRKSVERTADAGVSVSCTIRLNDQVYCVRDGGKWKDCPHGSGVNDLVIAIEKLYHS